MNKLKTASIYNTYIIIYNGMGKKKKNNNKGEKKTRVVVVLLPKSMILSTTIEQAITNVINVVRGIRKNKRSERGK